eukprot:GILJ01007910.1.p1 GENE.GILJ01007910.1~~GILJ01007910.1.p1  ORF type:complete len:1278 (-),score=327.26 GILJ01007910.1:105-3938(-)
MATSRAGAPVAPPVPTFDVGDRVIANGKKGYVRFYGPTQFAAGIWVGVELDDADGKNNGTVQDISYFDCEQAHGLFVRPALVQLAAEDHKDAAATSRIPRVQGAPPPSIATLTPTKQPSSRDLTEEKSRLTQKKADLAAQVEKRKIESPAPSDESTKDLKRPVVSESPSRAPSVASSMASTSLATPPTAKASPSMTVTKQLQPQTPSPSAPPSTAPPATVPKPSTAVPTAPPSMLPAPGSAFSKSGTALIPPVPVSRPASQTGSPSSVDNEIPPQSTQERTRSSPSVPKMDDVSVTSSGPQLNSAALAALTAERDELQKQLQETKERLQATLQDHHNKLSSVLTEAGSKVKDLESKLKAAEEAREKALREVDDKLASLQQMVEVLTLDKEIASARNEELELELEEKRQEAELASLERDELKAAMESTHETRIITDSDPQSMQLQVDRLKEALKRLHDGSRQEKAEHLRRIQELEKDANLVPELKQQLIRMTQLTRELEKSQGEVEELKQMLDEARIHESMVESLTDKNLQLEEKISELQSAMDDLQELRDMSEEIEESHLELEKQLQRDLDLKDVQLQEHKEAMDRLKDQMSDQLRTMEQFRQRVRELEREIQLLREQLSNSGEGEKVNKIHNLLQQQMDIQKRLQEMRRGGMKRKIREVELSQSVESVKMLELCVPANVIQQEMKLISPFQLFQRLFLKFRLAWDELHEDFIANQGVADLEGFRTFQFKLLFVVNRVIKHCKRIVEQVLQSADEQVLELIQGALFRQLASREKEGDVLLRLLQEQELTERYPLDSLNQFQTELEQFSNQYPVQGSTPLSYHFSLRQALYRLHELQTAASDADSAAIGSHVSKLQAVLRKLDSDPELPSDASASIALSIQATVEQITKPEGDSTSDLSQVLPFYERLDGITAQLIGLLKQQRSETAPSILAGTSWASRWERLRNSLLEATDLREQLTQLNTQIKEQSRRHAELDREYQESTVLRQNLERRLAEAKLKSDRCNQLETELERLKAQQRFYHEALEELHKDIEKANSDKAELQEQVQFYMEQQKTAGSNAPSAVASPAAAAPVTPAHRRRQSMVYEPESHVGGPSIGVSAQMIRQLQKERAMLRLERGGLLLQKLKPLPGSQQNRLSIDKRELVGKAVKDLIQVTSQLQRQRCAVKIVDLSNEKDQPLEQLHNQLAALDVYRRESKRLAKELSQVIPTSKPSTSASETVSKSSVSKQPDQKKILLGKITFPSKTGSKSGAAVTQVVPITVSAEQFNYVHRLLSPAMEPRQ